MISSNEKQPKTRRRRTAVYLFGTKLRSIASFKLGLDFIPATRDVLDSVLRLLNKKDRVTEAFSSSHVQSK